MKTLTWLVAVAVIVTALAPVFAPPARAEPFVVTSETVARGTSDGFGNQAAVDGVSNVKTEGGTAHPGTLAWLKPDADAGQNQWSILGCTPVSHYACVDDNPVHDGNVSYLSANPATPGIRADNWTIANFTPAAGVLNSIDSVSDFVWARRNSSNPAIFYTSLFDGAGWCAAVGSALTQAYSNVSSAGYIAACSGGAWTQAKVNALVGVILCYDDGLLGNEPDCTATAFGVVVTYTYTNTFYSDFTDTFSDVHGLTVILSWDCTTTDTEGLDLYVDGTRLATGVCFTGSTSGSLDLGNAPDFTSYVVRLVSPTKTGDTTQSTYTFDRLSIDAQQPPAPISNPLLVTCSFTWPSMDIVCAADELVSDPAAITVRAWELDGTIVLSGTNESLRYATLPSGDAWYAPGLYNHTVRYHVWVGNTEIVSNPVYVSLDTNWLWALYLLVVMVIGVGLLMRVKVRKEPEGPPPRKET